jgi:hypothetical protein
MGTGRKLQKAPKMRPKKSAAERRRRVKTQKRRLVAQGVSEGELRQKTDEEVRAMLRKKARR